MDRRRKEIFGYECSEEYEIIMIACGIGHDSFKCRNESSISFKSCVRRDYNGWILKLVGKAAFPQSMISRDKYKMDMNEDEMGKK